jgi:hypothetical protein
MAKEDLLLRSVSNPPLVTKGSALTLAEFDGNIIEIYNALVSLSQSSNIDAYDNAVTYTLGDAVMYNGQLYKCIVASVSAITPGTDPTKWEAIYATDLVQQPKIYKRYRALVTQVGTSLPTVIELENEIGAISWLYGGVGYYTINSAGLFTLDKTMIFNGTETGGLGGAADVKAGKIDANQLFITTTKTPSDHSGLNGALNKTSIEIIVYN